MYYQGHYAVDVGNPAGNRFEVRHREFPPEFDPRIPAIRPA